jgi:hypothetical protein
MYRIVVTRDSGKSPHIRFAELARHDKGIAHRQPLNGFVSDFRHD